MSIGYMWQPIVNICKRFGSRWYSSDKDEVNLPPLPKHPKRGLRVETGDRLAITNLSLSVQDGSELEGVEQRSFRMRVPPWNTDYHCGATFALRRATFALRRKLEAGTSNIDEGRVDISEEGWTIDVGLNNKVEDPVRSSAEIANRVLDVLAAEAFRVFTLDDPLRSHSVWIRDNGKTILRAVTTGRLAVSMRMRAEVRDPTGELRQQEPSPSLRWYASHAYFRRSQVTDNLHEAYRNLFLALEALLSEVYPHNARMGERAWLKAALEHVMEGYELDLSQFVGGSGGNPYRRFLKEQYRARRCALFHSKVYENPMIPGDMATREELIVATRRLGELFVRLSKLITGAKFGGGRMSEFASEQMMKSQADSPLYVSEAEDFDLDKCILTESELVLNAYGQSGLHLLRGNWATTDIPQRLRRVGSLVRKDDHFGDGIYESVDIDTTGASELEVVLQNEFVNAEHLREWFL